MTDDELRAEFAKARASRIAIHRAVMHIGIEIAVCTIVLGVLIFSAHCSPIQQSLTQPSYADAMLSFTRDPMEPEHPVYRYSVVPGGADTLAQAREIASTLGGPYGKVNLSNLREVVFGGLVNYYSTYRWEDGKVYWTVHPTVHPPYNEAAYSDGVHILRARCLNLLSPLPMKPTRTIEPKPAAFDEDLNYAPLVPISEALPEESPLPELETPPSVPPDIAEVPSRSIIGAWPPLGIVPVVPLVVLHRKHPNAPSVPVVAPPVVSIVTPEPEPVWVLLIVGLVLLVVDWQLRKRRDRGDS